MEVVMELKAEMEMEMEMQGRCVLPKTVKGEGPVVNGSLLSTTGPR